MSVHVTRTLLLTAFTALLGVTSGRAQLTPCKTYNGMTAQSPFFIRDFLERTRGAYVRACGGGDFLQYYGASSIARDGSLCHYSEYELKLLRTHPPRLERTAMSQQTYVRIANSTCPSPILTNYTATNNLPQETIKDLFGIWHGVTSSLTSFDESTSWIRDDAQVRRMRDVILQGKSDRLIVLRAAMRRNFAVWKNYELDVADPDHSDRFYAVTVFSWFGRLYTISSISAGIY